MLQVTINNSRRLDHKRTIIRCVDDVRNNLNIALDDAAGAVEAIAT
jgi:hypothetical protein